VSGRSHAQAGGANTNETPTRRTRSASRDPSATVPQEDGKENIRAKFESSQLLLLRNKLRTVEARTKALEAENSQLKADNLHLRQQLGETKAQVACDDDAERERLQVEERAHMVEDQLRASEELLSAKEELCAQREEQVSRLTEQMGKMEDKIADLAAQLRQAQQQRLQQQQQQQAQQQGVPMAMSPPFGPSVALTPPAVAVPSFLATPSIPQQARQHLHQHMPVPQGQAMLVAALPLKAQVLQQPAVQQPGMPLVAQRRGLLSPDGHDRNADRQAAHHQPGRPGRAATKVVVAGPPQRRHGASLQRAGRQGHHSGPITHTHGGGSSSCASENGTGSDGVLNWATRSEGSAPGITPPPTPSPRTDSRALSRAMHNGAI